MPFTFAHPAAAVPLRRVLGRRGVLSALVIGSMAPDFHYFLPFDLDRMDTHSAAGILYFCMPVGLLTYASWHRLLRQPLLALLPAQVAWRLQESPPVVPPSFAAVLASLLAGVLTHLLWDTFTHAGARGVRLLPWLRRTLFSFDGYDVPVYKLVQHGSALIGLALLALWIVRWWRRTRPAATPPAGHPVLSVRARNRVLGALGCAMAVAACAAAVPVLQWSLGPAGWFNPYVLRLALRDAVIAATAALFAGILVYSAAWHVRHIRHAGRP